MPALGGRGLRAGGERLIHVYGPTECTTFATWHMVEAVTPGARTIRSGVPSQPGGLRLDCHMRPVPIGVTGELHIGGDGLARVTGTGPS